MTKYAIFVRTPFSTNTFWIGIFFVNSEMYVFKYNLGTRLPEISHVANSYHFLYIYLIKISFRERNILPGVSQYLYEILRINTDFYH